MPFSNYHFVYTFDAPCHVAPQNGNDKCGQWHTAEVSER